MAFYRFNQNNSGGRFLQIMGMDAFNVLIEASSAQEANERAENVTCGGIYFNGVNDDRDCPCCGDRWTECYEGWDREEEFMRPTVKDGDSIVFFADGTYAQFDYYSDVKAIEELVENG